MKRTFSILLVLITLLSIITAAEAENIVILYTTDIHGSLEKYLDVAAAKARFEQFTPYVVLVDSGDHIQGQAATAILNGENAIDYMNLTGYDYAVLGNHEFDYGLDRMKELAGMANFTYLGCNVNYTGQGENKLDFLQDYAIETFGDVKVAFIGISQVESIRSSTPVFFMEGGEFVYNFCEGEKGQILYDRVQQTVDAARAEGADYVIILSHLGLVESEEPYRSIDLIHNLSGVNAVLDGHSHVSIPMQSVFDAEGKEVILSAAGYQGTDLGELLISDKGFLVSTLLSGEHADAPAEIIKGAEAIDAKTIDKLSEVVGYSNTELTGTDENGLRTIRCRETNLGDFIADAFRTVGNAEIGLINGGGIRALIPQGDITIKDMLSVQPFGNTLAVTSVKGSVLLELLEWTSRLVQNKANDGLGKPIGENGGFLQVSGLKYTIDTSVESPCIADDKGIYFGMLEDAPTRVSDVQVQLDGAWQPLDPERMYSVASISYILLNSGSGCSMLKDSEVLIETQTPDYSVLITYLSDVLNGDLSQYTQTDTRITVK